jgi:SAM-dependent methyltransferase
MMADQKDEQAGIHATASGHALSGAAWLDAHFERSRAIYEAMAQAVGLEPGWRVLDAGCGPGSFLPTLAALVGPEGALTALDLDAENLATAESRVAAAPLACPVAFRQGSVTALPFPDGMFDAAWCANVSQYLPDDEFAAALGELRRVVRPGGLVAIKETDGTLRHYYPMDPAIWLRLLATALDGGDVQGRGVVRAAVLRRWLERAGLEATWQQSFPDEHWAPLVPAVREADGTFLRLLATLAERADLPPGDRDFWRAQTDPASPDALVNHPAYYHRSGYVLAVGRVPAGG